MSLFHAGAQPALDDNGDTISGATWTFYLTGTTTAVNVYSDSTLDTSLGNVVTADADGRFVPIYLDDTVEYRAILKDAGGATLTDIDPVTGDSSLSDLLTRMAVNVLDYGAEGDGITDDTTAIQAAIDAADGRVVYFPAGNYVVTETLNCKPTNYIDSFGPGVKLYGEGIHKTLFDNRVANGPMIDIDSETHGGAYKAAMGNVLYGFTINTTTSPANSIGIRILNGYQIIIQHVFIQDMTSHGIELKNGAYTDDGWNMVRIENCWIQDCAGWGIKADGSSGRNEGSYTKLSHVFFQRNGTTSADATPPSGGMIWKGQVLLMEQCAFANGTENVGLFVKGESGLGQTADLQGVTFENCKKRGLYATGISVFRARNLQFYNNDTYTATVQCEFDGASYTVRNVDIEGVTVRATSGNNPITAFKISGANAELNTCRVRKVTFENFDYTGQTRFDGWQFDRVAQCCALHVVDASTLSFKPRTVGGDGRDTPLRLRGPQDQSGGGTASSSGEWIAYQVPSTGISKTNSGLSNATRYYAYLYDNDGSVAIELSTTASAQDTASGYFTKSGDATKLYIGSVLTDGSANFTTTGTGWLNPSVMYDGGTTTGTPFYLWQDSTGDVRVHTSAPASDTAGTIIGTQS